MSRRALPAAAVMLGAAVGALLSAALLSSPVANADDLATLPVPPFDDPNSAPIYPPGMGGDWTNVEEFKPSFEVQYDQAYTLPDGSYEIQGVQEPYNGSPEPWFNYGSEQVISSDGVAPPVGTEWNGETFQIPSFGFEYGLFENSSLTTSAGMVDVLTSLQAPWSNDFYDGPAGIFDYWVNDVGTPNVTAIPIIDMPAETSSAAAADFSTLWSDLLGTL